MVESPPGGPTLDDGSAAAAYSDVRRFRLLVLEGGEIGAKIESTSDRCSIGSHPACQLVLDEPTVSRFHCEIRLVDGGARVVDLGSRNGTMVDGVRIRDADLGNGSVLRLGRAAIRFDYELATNRIALSGRDQMGDMVGGSPAMRATYALLERAAATSMTVLFEGETGTGKSVAAYEVHRQGARTDGPFVTVDCGAIPPSLLESELFGHERGAFTGADAQRIGAFEEADGGTLFLDEIGELPLDLQSKLLRILETRELRRVGGSKMITVDVRVLAATNHDVRAAVNDQRFRADLYYRLAVVTIRLPPLRERRDDLPVLVEQILRSLGARGPEAQPLRTADALAEMASAPWPGNVRELRNHVQRCIFHGRALPVDHGDHARSAAEAETVTAVVEVDLEFAEAKRRALIGFERRYLVALLERHAGNVAAAAAAAGLHRVSLHRLLRDHGLRAVR